MEPCVPGGPSRRLWLTALIVSSAVLIASPFIASFFLA